MSLSSFDHNKLTLGFVFDFFDHNLEAGFEERSSFLILLALIYNHHCYQQLTFISHVFYARPFAKFLIGKTEVSCFPCILLKSFLGVLTSCPLGVLSCPGMIPSLTVEMNFSPSPQMMFWTILKSSLHLGYCCFTK